MVGNEGEDMGGIGGEGEMDFRGRLIGVDIGVEDVEDVIGDVEGGFGGIV